MATLRVNPTRMELTRLKKRLTTARRGHKLLKDKRDEMMRQFIDLIKKNKELRENVEQELSGALAEFAMARAVMPSQALATAIMYPARSMEITVGHKNIMSVDVPVYKVSGQSGDSGVAGGIGGVGGIGGASGEMTELTHSGGEAASTLPYGFAMTSAQLDGAVLTLSAVLPRLIELAEAEKTCQLLADEIEKTRRRVNALEYVMIPQFIETIRTITMKLDENERGALTRLMKVKDMMVEQQVRAQQAENG